MLRYYLLVILVCCVIVPWRSEAQNAQPNKPGSSSVIPPSPEAANLGKYGELPINMYTGVPSISVPIHTVTCGNLQLPVSLSYNASGNKVEEFAPWTGLGWALNAGGVITRTVRGQPDDGYANTPGIQGFLAFTQSYPDRGQAIRNESLLEEMAKGCVDAEPDQFFFNFGGYSGQFSFSWRGNIIQSSDMHLVILPIFASNRTIIGWQLHTDQGAIYRFMERETTTLSSTGSGIKNCRPAYGSTHTSGWYLTSISDLNRRDSIVLSYDSYTIAYDKRMGESLRYNLRPGPDPDALSETGYSGCSDGVGVRDGGSSWSQLTHNGLRVREIVTSDQLTKVQFVPGQSRTDLAGLVSSNSINLKTLGAVVLTSGTTSVRRFDLIYSPSNSIGRLTLEAVEESNQGVRKPPYRFFYNPLALPAINSKAQDHWGYYNRKPNTTLIPEFVVVNPFNPTRAERYPGADRSVDPEACQAGVLRAIKYPTGGRTEFDYESNTYSYTQSSMLNEYHQILRRHSAEVNCSNTAQVSGAVKTVTVNTPFRIPKSINGIRRVLVTYTYDLLNVDHVTGNTKPYIAILDSSGVEVITITAAYNSTAAGSYSLALLPGPYTLVARATHSAYVDPSSGACDYAMLDLSFHEEGAAILTKLAGGLRIKAVRDYSGTDTSSYTITPPSTGLPGTGSGPGGTYGGSTRCDCVMYVAQSMTGLGTTQGSYVGYQFVSVTTGSRNAPNGRTDYAYSSPLRYPDVIRDELTFVPNESQAFATGLLIGRRDYAYADQRYLLVSRDTTIYRFYSAASEGVVVNHRGDKTIGNLSHPDFLFASYYPQVGHVQVDSTVHAVYGTKPGSGCRIDINKYVYDSKGELVVQQRKYLSTGEKLITYYSYPQEYSMPSGAIAELVHRHAWANPVEITTLKSSSRGVTRILSSQYTEFALNNGQVYPVAEAALETSRPLQLAEFTPSKLAAASMPDSAIKVQVRYERRDAHGNVLQYRAADATPIAYLWGYGATKVVAQVQNATYAELLSVLGQAVINQLAGPNPGTDTQVQQLLAPLRTQLPQARVTTYTHAPLVGITSQTDPSGRTSFYEYDALGRLQRTRDEQGRILMEQEYQYIHP